MFIQAYSVIEVTEQGGEASYQMLIMYFPNYGIYKTLLILHGFNIKLSMQVCCHDKNQKICFDQILIPDLGGAICQVSMPSFHQSLSYW